MFSKTVLVVFAVNFIFAGSAHEAFMPAVLAPAMKCFEAGNSAVVAVLQAMQERPETDVDRINLSCLFCKVIYLAKALRSVPTQQLIKRLTPETHCFAVYTKEWLQMSLGGTLSEGHTRQLLLQGQCDLFYDCLFFPITPQGGGGGGGQSSFHSFVLLHI